MLGVAACVGVGVPAPVADWDCDIVGSPEEEPEGDGVGVCERLCVAERVAACVGDVDPVPE